MRVHALKSWPAYFDAVANGRKMFEIRKNDRDYKVGDVLMLRKFDPTTGLYLPPRIVVVVTYVTETGCPFVPDGFVAMGIRDAEYHETLDAIRTLNRNSPGWDVQGNA
jgi:hypothetical protein